MTMHKLVGTAGKYDAFDTSRKYKANNKSTTTQPRSFRGDIDKVEGFESVYTRLGAYLPSNSVPVFRRCT